MTQSQNINDIAANNSAIITAVTAAATASKVKQKENEQLVLLLAFLGKVKEELEALGSKSSSSMLGLNLGSVSSAIVTSDTPAASPTTPPPIGSTDNATNDNEAKMANNLCDALAQAAYFLSEMEAEIVGKYSLAANTDQTEVMAAQRKTSEQKLQDSIQQADQLFAEQQEEASESPWEKAFSIIASVFTTLIAVATGQPQVAALMILMTVLNDTGATNKIIGNSLGATLGVLAVTAVLSAGAGGAASGVRLAAALVVQNTVQMVTSTQGLQNIMQAIPMSDSERQKWTAIVTGILAVVALAAAAYGGNVMSKAVNAAQGAARGAQGAAQGAEAAAQGAEAAAEDAAQGAQAAQGELDGFAQFIDRNEAEGAAAAQAAAQDNSLLSKLAKLRTTIVNAVKGGVSKFSLNSPAALYGMQDLQKGFSIATSGLQVREGQINVDIGKNTGNTTADLAVIELMQTLMNMTSTSISDRQSIVSNQLQQSQSNQQVISSWLSGEKAFAQAYAQSV